MSAYDRSTATDCRVIDRWEAGVGWLAHPEEPGVRASHAVSGADGVWLVDPLDAPGVEGLVADLGEVAGVTVLSNWHARDAAVFADRHGVPVTVPPFLDRAASQVDARVERAEEFAGFELHHLNPLRLWHEAVAYRERDATLYVPDFLTADPRFTVGEERVAMSTFARLRPPRQRFEGFEPERLLFGHGEGVSDDATAALRSGFDGARRRFPRALVRSGPGEVRMMLSALG